MLNGGRVSFWGDENILEFGLRAAHSRGNVPGAPEFSPQHGSCHGT